MKGIEEKDNEERERKDACYIYLQCHHKIEGIILSSLEF